MRYIKLIPLLCFIAVTPSTSFAENNHEVVHSHNGKVVTNTFGLCVRTRWMTNYDECAVQPAVWSGPPAREPTTKERTVYFEFDKSRLMYSEQQKVNNLVTLLKNNQDIHGLRIVGYADRIGRPTYNQSLSRERAGTVEQYIKSKGYVNPTFVETRWLGESVPVTRCGDNLSRTALIECLQEDRRVEVELDYTPAE